MISKENLKDVLPELDVLTDKVLVCLSVTPDQPKSLDEIRGLARPAGEKQLGNSNITALLSAKKGIAIHTGVGWELTKKGRDYVRELIAPHINATTVKVSSSLRDATKKVANPTVRSFVEEAVGCFEAGHYRAAVVLTWVGAASILYEFILTRKLAEFNAEALRRDKKWKPATTFDDLARMPEYDFLQILAAISVVGKSVKDELEARLKLRNGCGHPNSLQIAVNAAAAHIEILVNNVFLKFA